MGEYGTRDNGAGDGGAGDGVTLAQERRGDNGGDRVAWSRP